MTGDASKDGTAPPPPASNAGPRPQARFEFLPPREDRPATVRAVGDIDLTNAAQFQAALDQAVACAAVTADMTAVTYCDSAAIRALCSAAIRTKLTIQVGTAGPLTGTLLRVSGLDQVATIVTRH